uniref:MBL fold metallo-hydrolase n=1 Tax=Ningiella ruwaisensis TaxID=2364274 RepID=UPI00109F626F|nr:MBL fold metallo-hydrolase [Ningiella ruwaisensis]
MSKLCIHPFIHEPTNTISYVVADIASKQAAVIDPVLDYELGEGKVECHFVDTIVHFLDDNNLNLEWIFETHAHADHLSGAHYLKAKRGGLIGIGEHITKVQTTFSEIFNLNGDLACDGSQFDYLCEDGEILNLGHLQIEVIHTPGHTPACVSYRVEDAVFVGDAILLPDIGTARADFPNGSARAMYQSIQRILSLPDKTRIFVGHDYQSPKRNYFAWETSVLEEKRNNIDAHIGIREDEFVRLRQSQDATLATPMLLMPALQVNIRAGKLPTAESNGKHYLKIPLSTYAA